MVVCLHSEINSSSKSNFNNNPNCFKIKSPCDRCLVSFSGEVKLQSTWLLKLSSRRTKGRPQNSQSTEIQ